MQLIAAVEQLGGSVVERSQGYVYATFPAPLGGVDDLEFLLSSDADCTVGARAVEGCVCLLSGWRGCGGLVDGSSVIMIGVAPCTINHQHLQHHMEIA